MKHTLAFPPQEYSNNIIDKVDFDYSKKKN